MIDRYQLRYFLAVVEAGNFSRAADRVNVTQPTLSVGIAKLERALGTALFLRNSKRVHLTKAGSLILHHARQVESGFHLVEQEVLGLKAPKLIRLGVLSTIPTAVTAWIVDAHGATSKPDRVEIVDGTERELLGQLNRGRIDVALTRIVATELRAEVLHREGYCLALQTGHPLAQNEIVRAEDLAGEAMIVRRSCELMSETSRHFTSRGVRPEFSFRSFNDDKVLSMVRAGLGITVMPDSYREPGVARRKLADFDYQRKIGLLFAEHAQDLADQSFSLIATLRGVSLPMTAISFGPYARP